MAIFFKKILERKFLSTFIILIILGAGYFGYGAIFGNKNTTRYITSVAKKDTIVVSVTGSGQVSASTQIDIKSKVSGDAIFVGPSAGEYVGVGALIAQLDTADAEKAVRDAEVNLESAKLTMQKLVGSGGTTSPKNTADAQNNLKTAYDAGFNSVSNAFLDLPSVMTGLQALLYNNDFSNSQPNVNFYGDAVKNYDTRSTDYSNKTIADFQTAKQVYSKNSDDYKAVNRFSDQATIDLLINETYATTQSISEAIKSANNLIQFYQDRLTERLLVPATLSNTHLNNLNSYTSKTNTHLQDLLNAQSTIKNDKDAIDNAGIDINSQELAIEQRQNALADAKQQLDYYYIRAPFGGVVATINVKKGDSISPSTVISSFITEAKIAEIPLNETDVARVKVGEKATLTFDAIPDLSIAGTVAEIDTLGTVTQGVVNYNIKILFTTQDSRVKSGMSVSAAIITDTKTNILVVPNSALKSQGGSKYVGVLVNGVPQNKDVQTGLSNDTSTEIISGINEGDNVITQTIAGTASSQTTTQTGQSTNGIRIPGLTGGGGGFRGGGGN